MFFTQFSTIIDEGKTNNMNTYFEIRDNELLNLKILD